MKLKEIEDTILKHTIPTLIAIPIALFGVVWLGFLSFVPVDIRTKPEIQISCALLGLLLSTLAVCIPYIILLKRRLKEKPDLSPFTHDPDKACWINKTTGERICEACKAEGKLVLLSKFPTGWICPLHRDRVVDYQNNNTPTYDDKYIETSEDP